MLTSLATGLCALGFGASVHAGDTMRLDGKGEDAETLQTRGGHGGFGHGGFGHGYGGRGYYGGGYGRGYYGGYGRSFYGGGFYGRGYGYGGFYGRGYYGGGFYRPYYGYGYGGGYYGSYYGSPVYYSSPSYYYSPCADADSATITLGAATAPVTNDVTVLRPVQYAAPQYASSTYTPQYPPQDLAPQYAAPQPRTFQYDGGAPRIPLPRENAPMSTPKSSTIPFEGKLVSLPANSSSYSFRAYGENMLTPAATPARDTVLVSHNVGGNDTFQLSMPLETTGGTTSLR